MSARGSRSEGAEAGVENQPVQGRRCIGKRWLISRRRFLESPDPPDRAENCRGHLENKALNIWQWALRYSAPRGVLTQRIHEESTKSAATTMQESTKRHDKIKPACGTTGGSTVSQKRRRLCPSSGHASIICWRSLGVHSGFGGSAQGFFSLYCFHKIATVVHGGQEQSFVNVKSRNERVSMCRR